MSVKLNAQHPPQRIIDGLLEPFLQPNSLAAGLVFAREQDIGVDAEGDMDVVEVRLGEGGFGGGGARGWLQGGGGGGGGLAHFLTFFAKGLGLSQSG